MAIRGVESWNSASCPNTKTKEAHQTIRGTSNGVQQWGTYIRWGRMHVLANGTRDSFWKAESMAKYPIGKQQARIPEMDASSGGR